MFSIICQKISGYANVSVYFYFIFIIVYDNNNQDRRGLINNCANRINFLILSHLDSHYRKVIYETDYSCLAAKVFNGLSFIRLIANFFRLRLKIELKSL